MDNNDSASTDQKPSITHNISINVTDTDSPTYVRRRIHLRSLSDVTPASRAHTPRARSHSERPAPSPAPSPARSPAHASSALASPAPARVAAAGPRFVRSERSSPDASLRALEEGFPGIGRRFPGDHDTDGVVLGNPWRKMSEIDLNSADYRTRTGGRSILDPWIRIPNMRSESACDRPASRNESSRAAADPEQKREATVFKRGKLERKSPVVCESCGNESCECWRARGACTCSPRRSPARARRLHKSASQKLLGASLDSARGKPADPLLETTC